MIFKWTFGTKEIESFARSLAADFAQKCPADSAKTGNRALQIAQDDLVRNARQFGRERRLGLYKKAKFSNTLKWELKDMGYDDKLIDDILKGMLIAMASKK